MHRTNEFNNRTWLKPYIDINTDLRKKGKDNFKKHFFKLMYKKVFRKIMNDVGKYRDTKLVTT